MNPSLADHGICRVQFIEHIPQPGNVGRRNCRKAVIERLQAFGYLREIAHSFRYRGHHRRRVNHQALKSRALFVEMADRIQYPTIAAFDFTDRVNDPCFEFGHLMGIVVLSQGFEPLRRLLHPAQYGFQRSRSR